MIVYDLACGSGHRFEGWFASSADFAEQAERGLVTCPQCGSEDVGKAPMAPAVPKKGSVATSKPMQGGDLPVEVKQALQKLATVQAEALKTSEYVGDRFAEESRAIHYGEREGKPIHGKATLKEGRELLEEGIAIAPIIAPFTPPDEVN